MDAALQVFAQDSFHGSSMASVAKRAKVSKGLIYNYFESKDQILKTLILALFEELMEQFEIDPTVPLTRHGFIKVIELSINEVIKNPQRWKLYMSLSFQPDVLPILLSEMMPKLQPFMIMMSNYFISKGHKDPMAMMRYYSAVLDGVQMHLLMDPDNFPIDKVKQMMIEQFA